MIIYIKDDKIVKVTEKEFDVDELDRYDIRIDTDDFMMSDILDYKNWNVVKLDPIEEDDPFATPPEA